MIAVALWQDFNSTLISIHSNHISHSLRSPFFHILSSLSLFSVRKLEMQFVVFSQNIHLDGGNQERKKMTIDGMLLIWHFEATKTRRTLRKCIWCNYIPFLKDFIMVFWLDVEFSISFDLHKMEHDFKANIDSTNWRLTNQMMKSMQASVCINSWVNAIEKERKNTQDHDDWIIMLEIWLHSFINWLTFIFYVALMRLTFHYFSCRLNSNFVWHSFIGIGVLKYMLMVIMIVRDDDESEKWWQWLMCDVARLTISIQCNGLKTSFWWCTQHILTYQHRETEKYGEKFAKYY